MNRIIQIGEILKQVSSELTNLEKEGEPKDKTANLRHYDFLKKKIAHYESLLQNYGKGIISKCNTSAGIVYYVNITYEEAEFIVKELNNAELISYEEISAGLIIS